MPTMRCGFVSLENSLRIASVSDAATLSSIHEECFPNYWNGESFTDFFSVAGTSGYIVSNPDPVAMIIYRVQHEQADIITLGVRNTHRRRGIARMLVEKALADCRALGAQELFLDVENGNQPALSLYESLGFTFLRRRKLYYRQTDGTYTDALVMTCKLA
jgi:ribosomal-protein-alanine N-acetyltransferase